MVTVGDWYDILTSTIAFSSNNSSFSSNVFTNPSNGLIEYDRYSTPCVLNVNVTINASMSPAIDNVTLRILWNGSEVNYCEQLLKFTGVYVQISYSFMKMIIYDGSITNPILLKLQVQPTTQSGNNYNVNLSIISISTSQVFS